MQLLLKLFSPSFADKIFVCFDLNFNVEAGTETQIYKNDGKRWSDHSGNYENMKIKIEIIVFLTQNIIYRIQTAANSRSKLIILLQSWESQEYP
jgi:hypothetical protein